MIDGCGKKIFAREFFADCHESTKEIVIVVGCVFEKNGQRVAVFAFDNAQNCDIRQLFEINGQ